MHIPVIFEDSDILIIDKPSGLVVHPFDFSTEETLLDFLHDKYHDKYLDMFSIENAITLQDGRTVPLGGIVHKLDRETSGVMIIAKNKDTFDALKTQFIEQKIEKTYIALVEGSVEKHTFRIDAPLGRSKKDYKQSTKPENPRGTLREAITDVEVIRRKENTTLVKLVPRTGRTHQLRAHMASIGHPIVGDVAYGSKVHSERIMLHAASLGCMVQGKKKTFEAPASSIFL